jgi:hypothetical protein
LVSPAESASTSVGLGSVSLLEWRLRDDRTEARFRRLALAPSAYAFNDLHVIDTLADKLID